MRASRRRTSGTVSAISGSGAVEAGPSGAFSPHLAAGRFRHGPAGGGEEGVGEHGEGDVPVPAGVTADLVLVEAALVLRGLEAFFDLPAASGDPGQVGEGGVQRSAGQEVGDVLGVGDAAAGQHPPQR